MSEVFDVWQELGDVKEKVRSQISAEEAIKAFQHYTQNVAAKMGLTNRVIIVDQLDCINMEWLKGKGIVFPPK